MMTAHCDHRRTRQGALPWPAVRRPRTPRGGRAILCTTLVLTTACVSGPDIRDRALLEIFAHEMNKQGLEALTPPRSSETFDAGWVLRPSGVGGDYIWNYCRRSSPGVRSSRGASRLTSDASVVLKRARSRSGPKVPIVKLSGATTSTLTESVKVTLRDTEIRATRNADIRALVQGCPDLPWDGKKIEFAQEIYVGNFDLQFRSALADADRLKIGALVFESQYDRTRTSRRQGTYSSKTPIVIGFKRDCIEKGGWDVWGFDELMFEGGLVSIIAGAIIGFFAVDAAGAYNDRCARLGNNCGGDPVATAFGRQRDTNALVSAIVGGAGLAASTIGLTRYLLPNCPRRD